MLGLWPSSSPTERCNTRGLLRDASVRLSYRIKQGPAGECLNSEPADLLVVGAGRHHRLVGRMLGSVSAHIGQHCRIPVVIVPCPTEPIPVAATSTHATDQRPPASTEGM